jgi:hypothetical protein
MQNMKRYLWSGTIFLALVVLGCNRASGPSDSQVATDVQNKIYSDANIPDKQITINSNKGVVTLSGTVSSDAERAAAATDAAQVNGVKTVVNNLEVASASNVTPPPPEPTPTAPPPGPTGGTAQARVRQSNSGGNGGNNAPASNVPPSNTVADNTVAPTPEPTPTPPPPPQKVTVPAGTQFSIRMTDEVSSEKAQVGDTFRGSISAPITVDDQVVIPNTADVEGHVVDVKSAGRFAGGSVLTLQLTKLTMNGKSYSITTDQWSQSGKGKGKGTAAKVGGGAALGAVLGGIFGGGKGAAIGTVAGAGAGTAGSAVGKGQQIDLKPEAVINFSLQNSLTVTLPPPGSGRQPMQQ